MTSASRLWGGSARSRRGWRGPEEQERPRLPHPSPVDLKPASAAAAAAQGPGGQGRGVPSRQPPCSPAATRCRCGEAPRSEGEGGQQLAGARLPGREGGPCGGWRQAEREGGLPSAVGQCGHRARRRETQCRRGDQGMFPFWVLPSRQMGGGHAEGVITRMSPRSGWGSQRSPEHRASAHARCPCGIHALCSKAPVRPFGFYKDLC